MYLKVKKSNDVRSLSYLRNENIQSLNLKWAILQDKCLRFTTIFCILIKI